MTANERIPCPDQDVVVRSEIRLSRNYQDLPFPRCMDESDRTLISERVGDALSGAAGRYDFLNLEALGANEKNIVCEWNLMQKKDLARFSKSSVLYDAENGINLLLCAADHILIQSTQPGLQLEQADDAAQGCEKLLDQRGAYAFDSQFGYLTGSPSLCGTGMRICATVHLPGLSLKKQLRPLSQRLSGMGIALLGGSIESGEAMAQYFNLFTTTAIGRSEEEMIAGFTEALRALTIEERSARGDMWADKPLLLEDRLQRTLGILQRARIMPAREMIPRLADLRLGVSLGMLELSIQSIDELCAQLRPAAMQRVSHETDLQALEALRADMLRKFTASIP